MATDSLVLVFLIQIKNTEKMNNHFQNNDYVAIHENPVWKQHSNFIIRVFLEEREGRNQWEQLWVKQIGTQTFSICCIPFFAYNLALGDEVETDNFFNMTRVVKTSGQFTFRVWFGESPRLDIKSEVLTELQCIGAIVEWSSQNLLAISAQDEQQAQMVADYLYTKQHAQELIFETGRI